MTFASFPGGMIANSTEIANGLNYFGEKYTGINLGGHDFVLGFPMPRLFYNKNSAIPVEFEFRPGHKRIWQWADGSGNWNQADNNLYKQIILAEFWNPDYTKPPYNPPYNP